GCGSGLGMIGCGKVAGDFPGDDGYTVNGNLVPLRNKYHSMIFIALRRKLETRFSCPDGEVGNKGFPRLISHLKRLHLPFDEHKELKIVLCKVVTQPDSIDAWVRLLLFPRCTLQVYRLKNRQERRSGNKKSLQQSSILRSLAMWGEDDGITMLVKIILDGSMLGSFGQREVKVLSFFDVAPYCDDTIKDLEAKYPYKPPLLMPSITYSEPPFVAEIDSVFNCIKSFPKGSATATYQLKFITTVVNFWLVGRCPLILAEFVASALLTPLLKPDNGIRPIAVGTIRRRLISKVAMKGMGKEMLKYHSDFQFGVGVSGGAKAILHSVNRVLSEYHNDGSLAMLTVDFLNAFNVTFLIFRLRLHPLFLSLLKNLRDTIDIRMDIIYPEPVAAVAFPATTVVRRLARQGEVIGGIHERLLEMPTQRWEEIEEELSTLREREREKESMAETEGITLRARVRSLELMETWFHGIVREEREACERLERQLGLIQEELESLRHSRPP
nr:hypothetical protein [Tanacetum cinerariifolium]